MNPNLTLLERLQAPTSKFFQPIVNAGVFIAALSALLNVFQTNLLLQGIPLPHSFDTLTTVLGWVAAAVAAIGKLTVDWDQLKKDSVLDNITARVNARTV